MADTTRLSLPYLAPAQAQKHVTHNDALQRLDALVQASVLAADVSVPPVTAAGGDSVLVAAAPTGGFAGRAQALAAFEDGAWRFYAPRPGWCVYVVTERQWRVFDGVDWVPAPRLIRRLAQLDGVGIGADPDATNRLVARLNAALFTAIPTEEGGSGSVRVVLNRATATGAASHLYQTGFSGRAETGLGGDDAWRLKVSTNGSTWRDALVADPATGAIALPAGVSDWGGSGPGDRNHLLNGGFAIAQRGAGPFALAAGIVRTLDGWLVRAGAGATGSVSQLPLAPGQGPTEATRFALRLVVTAGGTGAAAPALESRIEDVARLAGRPATLSFWYRAPAGLAVGLGQDFGTGGSVARSGLGRIVLGAAATWTRAVLRTTLPSLSGQTLGVGSFTAVTIQLPDNTTGTVDLADVQLEEGQGASAFARRHPAVELALARRYLRRSATALDPADLAFDMAGTPVRTGSGPYLYAAEL